MHFLISALGLVRIIALFYLPYSNAKILANAFEEDKEFSFEITENAVIITPKNGERKEILFKNISKAYELRDFFVIILGERFFPIPKDFMEKGQIEALLETFSKQIVK